VYHNTNNINNTNNISIIVATANISITIDEDLLKAVHMMRGDVPLARFFSTLALQEAYERGIVIDKLKYKLPESHTMFE
jgi:hypothetical protein